MDSKVIKRIVAVDDSNVVLKTLKNVLDKEEYELHAFTNGTRALEYLEQKDKMPDLIILDIEMPIMSGYDVLKRIKTIVHLKRVPVIFLTSHNEKQQVVQAVTDGVKDYVVKPIDKEVLLKRVHSLLYD
ncbi:MAG: response regulator [Lachnospiraceae bacterium]|nr:response regulator [Lachnospiraceae bacterium]